ncbi:MAG: hypothetical protein JNJ54_35280 [Myxococcaceae bacterium]|nr:hypothetical protein [Myxococcaceae bacterium]
MIRPLAVLILIALAGCRNPAVSATPDEPLRLMPAALDFGETFVGLPVSRALTVTSPGRASRRVTLLAPAGFSAPAMVELEGGGEVAIEVRFDAAAVGPASGVLSLTDESRQETLAIDLSALAVPVPDCGPPEPCRTRRFDLPARRCVETHAPDGMACTGALACFASAQCVAGVCRGARVTCDDGNPCTLDVCSEVGCGQVDGTPFCPTSPNPCLVPVCSQDAGCGFEEVPDGTACGERTCTTALVCISGACVNRTPPRNQTCADLLVGVPAGNGFADGRGDDARFGFIVSMATQGADLLVHDSALLRRVRNGAVSTIAGRRMAFELVDGFGTNARIGSRSATLAATTQPGLFFLGDGTTIRLVSLQGQVVTLAGRADAGGTVDGVGAAARLSVDSVLRPGGAGARFLQLLRLPAAPPQLLVRDVSLSGAVRTIFTLDLAQLGLDGGPGDPSVWPAGVSETGPDLTAYFSMTDLRSSPSPRSYALTVSDAGFRIAEANSQLWWEGQGVEFLRDSSCLLTIRTDAGWRRGTACSGAWAFDGDGGAFVASRENITFTDRSGDRVVAGPTPDRRVVDGPADGGRLSYPRGLTVVDGGVAFIDATSSDGWLRVAWFTRTSPSLAVRVQTVDAGRNQRFAGAVSHAGELLGADESGFVWTVDPHTGAQGSRRGYAVNGLGRFASNGQSLRAAVFFIVELQGDGGTRVIPGVQHAYALASGPSGSWVTFGATDGGQSRQLLRIEADDSVTPIAGRPFAGTDDDGPALQAGITEVFDLTVAPDGTVYFLATGNRLKALRNGQVVTLLEFADTPTSLVALADGSLVVAVDAALLRVFP